MYIQYIHIYGEFDLPFGECKINGLLFSLSLSSLDLVLYMYIIWHGARARTFGDRFVCTDDRSCI